MAVARVPSDAGSLTIRDAVLAEIAYTEAMSTPGVVPPQTGLVRGLLRGDRPRGVQVETAGNEVAFRLALGVRGGVRMPDAADEVRSRVVSAVTAKTGYSVRAVNILVDHVAAGGPIVGKASPGPRPIPAQTRAEAPGVLTQELGTLEVAEEVFRDLVRQAVRELGGAAVGTASGIFRWRAATQAVQVERGLGEVAFSLGLCVPYEARIPEMVDELRRRVREAVEGTTGFAVRVVNVVVEHILPPGAAAAQARPQSGQAAEAPPLPERCKAAQAPPLPTRGKAAQAPPLPGRGKAATP